MIDIIKLIQEEIEDPKTVEITIRIESARIVFKVLSDNWSRHKKGDIVVYPSLSHILDWYRLNNLKTMTIPIDIGEYSVAIVSARLGGESKREHLKKLIESKLKKLFIEDVEKKAKSENISGGDITSMIARSYKKKDILLLPDHEKFRFNFIIIDIKEIK